MQELRASAARSGMPRFHDPIPRNGLVGTGSVREDDIDFLAGGQKHGRAFRRLARCAILAAAVHAGLVAAPRAQAPSSAWPDTFVSRLQALALIQTLNADILASRSATESLEKWCRDHQLAETPAIAARVVRAVDQPPSAAQRQRLQVGDRDEVKYRRVQLLCGGRLLSEAENWYVPGRLPAEANRLLDTTDAPFGTVVRSLEPYRRTFDVTLLWRPLPVDWAIRSPAGSTGGVLAIPDALIEHRAVLYTREHVPFSEVHEVYQRQVLPRFPPR